MTKNTIELVLCSGTACYVMGGSELLLIEEHFPETWQGRVHIEANSCLGYCRDRKNGRAPFALIDGQAVPNATVPEILRIIGEKLGD